MVAITLLAINSYGMLSISDSLKIKKSKEMILKTVFSKKKIQMDSLDNCLYFLDSIKATVSDSKMVGSNRMYSGKSTYQFYYKTKIIFKNKRIILICDDLQYINGSFTGNLNTFILTEYDFYSNAQTYDMVKGDVTIIFQKPLTNIYQDQNQYQEVMGVLTSKIEQKLKQYKFLINK